MSRTLIAMRHAKAESGSDDDMKRPLSKRGYRDAQLIANWLTTWCSNHHIQRIRLLVSPATRTQLTANIIAEAFSGIELEQQTLDSLYLASTGDLQHIVHQQADSDYCLAVVGHNPAMHALVQYYMNEMLNKFPTAATACLTFDTPHWQSISPGNCTDSTLIKPKYLRQK